MTFGFLNILDDCSDPADLDKIHPDIREFWKDILQKAHPNASEFFESIDPDTWHKHYKERVDFAADSRSIFRHVLDIANAPRYVPWNDIPQEERTKYVDHVAVPAGPNRTYDEVFDEAVGWIVKFWRLLFQKVNNAEIQPGTLTKEWNLDTGVDESKIDLWLEA